MKHLNLTHAVLFAFLVLTPKSEAQPISVGGEVFTLVATNAGDIQLYGLAADAQGNLYAGNNSNLRTTGIPLQRFRPSLFTGTAILFESVGPSCSDGDGMAFGADHLYVADANVGVRRISSLDGSATIFTAAAGTDLCGSALVFRTSDEHLLSNVGCRTTQIREFDSAGQFVTNYATTTGVQTMAFDAPSGTIYYASFPGGEVHAYDLAGRTDALIATIDGSIDGGLAVDRISNRLFVGTANGANQGRVYTIDLATHTVRLFASGFDGCLGILREQVSGDLYFLEAHNLYRLTSTNVVFSPKLFIWPAVELGWISDTNQTYQVQWASELDTNAWTDFGPPVQGTGMTNFLFDTTRTGPKRFYRVIVQP